jgi:hypothetical protein
MIAISFMVQRTPQRALPTNSRGFACEKRKLWWLQCAAAGGRSGHFVADAAAALQGGLSQSRIRRAVAARFKTENASKQQAAR